MAETAATSEAVAGSGAEMGSRMAAAELAGHDSERSPTRRRLRPRSAVTSGRQMFVQGDPNSAWSRRYYDLFTGHISDLGGKDACSEAQLSIARRCTTLECELERLEAALSRGEPVNLDEFGRAASHLRRLLETLGVERRPRDVTPSNLPAYLRSIGAEP